MSKLTTYSTYRCLSSNLGKYALLGSLKYKIENNLNIYPIFINFKASLSSGKYFDEGIYSLRVWQDGDILNTLISISNNSLFEVVLDVKTDTIDIYGTTSTVPGATITVEELESTNLGFIKWKNFEKFTFSDDNFTNKKTSVSFNKIVNSYMSFNKEITFNDSIRLNNGTIVAPIRCQRELNDGDVIEGNMYVNSLGKLFIGLRGTESETLGNENYSALRLAKNQIEHVSNFVPDITNRRTLGNQNYKYKCIYTNSMQLFPVSELPTTDLINGLTVFYSKIKMQCTYYDGKWYNSKGEEIA